MPSVCFYFQVHQPERIKRYRVFDIGNDRNYFNDDSDTSRNNLKILNKVSAKSYLPTNKILLELIHRHPEFRVSFSLSGIFLEAIERDAPEVLKSFQDLVETGNVEILSETYYHSLSYLYSPEEFRDQVKEHRDMVARLFGVVPRVFRNTELIYNNELAQEIEDLGYSAILAEGADHVLEWRSPNFVYTPTGTRKIKLLLKNYRLSDDIAFRFGSRDWKDYPLIADKFAAWVNAVNGSGDTVNLFMDYETFGEHQWEDTGIFEFLKALPEAILRHPDNRFLTPSQVAERHPAISELSVPHFVSWADIERDLSAWRSNDMQRDALETIYGLEKRVQGTGDRDIVRDWKKLQTSDHFYYMCTKWFADGDVHKYFNPYETPYEAFIAYMNVVHDLKLRIEESEKQKTHKVKLRKLA